MNPLGKTDYKFSSKIFGKRPKHDGSIKIKRSKKTYGVRKLRPWQNEAFKTLCESKSFLIKAFCGAGKTTISIVLSLFDVIKSGRKQLFVVPQEHIGDGFAVSGKFNVPGLGVVHLSSANNFCEDSDNKVEMLKNFMTRDESGKDFSYGKDYAVNGSDMIAVCTHSAFNLAMKKIAKDGDLDKIKDLSVYIDEAHHIKGGDAKSSEEDTNYNQLGENTYKILEKANKNNFRVGLTTATYYRGDQGIIIKKQFLDNFDRFELEFMEHFETLNIENVKINFEEYEKDPIIQIVENIRKELNERHFIVIPSRTHKWREGDEELKRLKKAILDMLIEEGVENPEDIVLDLVTESTQKNNKSILLKEPKEKYDEENPSKIKIVITCMLGREGTDWCACSRLHNACIELGSTTLAVQTLGRLFRKFEGKDNVGVTYYIKKFNNLKSSTSKLEFLSDRINAMLSLMIIDDLLNPIILPDLPLVTHGCKKTSKKAKTSGVSLREIFGDDYETIRKHLINRISIESSFEEETVDLIIEETISKFGITKDIVEIKNKFGEVIKATSKDNVVAGLKVFLLRARSEALRSKGIDISVIRKFGFSHLVESNGLFGNFWCGKLTKKDFKKLKEIIGKVFWNKDQYDQIASNCRKIVATNLGCDFVDSNKKHETIARKILKSFCEFHSAYNYVSEKYLTPVPSRSDVAAELKITLEELDEQVDDIFNQILPKGYQFFSKNSKLSEKMAIDFAA